MITFKTSNLDGEKVIQIDNIEMANTHFQLLVNGGKIKVVSISKNSVVVEEIGKSKVTYSGDEKDMLNIVDIASKVHLVAKKLKKKMVKEINK